MGMKDRWAFSQSLTGHFFVLIGIAPLSSARTALWMREHLPGTIIPDAVIDRLARAGDPKAEGKRICLELLHELIPKSVTIGFVVNPSNPNAEPDTKDAQAAAYALQRKLVIVKVSAESDFETASITLVQERVGALLGQADRREATIVFLTHAAVAPEQVILQLKQAYLLHRLPLGQQGGHVADHALLRFETHT